MEAFTFTDLPLAYLVESNKFQFTDEYVTPEATIPKGFVTDGASVPRILQNLFPSYYKYFPAAAVHDYLYGSGKYPRKECDRIFRDNMRLRLKLGWSYWGLMYYAVRLFGTSHYTKRTTEGNTVAKVTA